LLELRGAEVDLQIPLGLLSLREQLQQTVPHCGVSQHPGGQDGLGGEDLSQLRGVTVEHGIVAHGGGGGGGGGGKGAGQVGGGEKRRRGGRSGGGGGGTEKSDGVKRAVRSRVKEIVCDLYKVIAVVLYKV
jgi:hypothetical protein